MPTLGLLGDVHAHAGRLARSLTWLAKQGPFDGVLLVGDIAGNPGWARRAHPEELVRMRMDIGSIVRQVEQTLNTRVLFVPGNHDPKDVAHPGNVDRRQRTLAGLRIVGLGGAGPDLFGLPYEWEEAEVDALDLPEWDVLLSHCPPRDTALDVLRGGPRHVGSAAVRRRAESGHGLLVSGHIHESVSAEVLGGTLCVNVGGLGEPHGKAQAAVARFRESPDGWQVRIQHRDLEPGGKTKRWSHAISRTPVAGLSSS
jgi:Icc-related predicted phosphoesterase